MEITVTKNMLPDLFAASALITLAVYHLMIYWGRRKDLDEIYNLYFAFFVLSASLMLITIYFQPQYFLYRYKPTFINVINIEMLSVWLLFFTGMRFLNHLLKVPLKFNKYFYIFLAAITLNFLATLCSNLISIKFYYKYLLGPILLTVAVIIIIIYILYGIWIFREKLYKNNFIRIIFFGFVLLTLNIFIYRAIELSNIPLLLIPNHYLTAVLLYIFAYALSVKFNKEHQELKELKVSLERKVDERTEELKTANQILEKKNIEIEFQKQEIIAINKELSIRADELKELDTIKSRFFTNISHEFRTPLTMIIGPLESLIEKTTSKEHLVEYELMLKHTRKLLLLINQLLELSKLQKNMIKLQLSNDRINTFLRTIVSVFTSLAQELNIELSFHENLPEQELWFDKDKLEKIVTNLLSNALKYTPGGGKVTIVIRSSVDINFIELIIADNGIGIEKEELNQIFDPFYQVESSQNAKFTGTGIGLALVKELVTLHKGYIYVKSEVSKGSEFTVGIPADKKNYMDDEFLPVNTKNEISIKHIPIEKPDENGRKSQVSKEKALILIVDDNIDMRNFITRNLDEYQILQAENGSEGFKEAVRHIPDLIITDIMMPVMNGIELTRSLKTNELTNHIPIIILTAKASFSSKLEGLETEADDYLVKPFNMNELKTRIKNLIQVRQKLREKYGNKFLANPSMHETESMDEKFVNRALEIVEKNIDNPEYNMSSFCKDLNLSRTQVHRKLTALTGQSATEFIRTIRIKRAAQLLQQNSGSVAEIAVLTGFNNMSYFTKAFKDVFGISPSEYRNKA